MNKKIKIEFFVFEIMGCSSSAYSPDCLVQQAANCRKKECGLRLIERHFPFDLCPIGFDEDCRICHGTQFQLHTLSDIIRRFKKLRREKKKCWIVRLLTRLFTPLYARALCFFVIYQNHAFHFQNQSSRCYMNRHEPFGKGFRRFLSMHQ